MIDDLACMVLLLLALAASCFQKALHCLLFGLWDGYCAFDSLVCIMSILIPKFEYNDDILEFYTHNSYDTTID